jgi:hypothetical protein
MVKLTRLNIVIILICVCPLALASEDSDTFVHRTKGIKITKPHSWYFLNPSQIIKGRNNVELSDGELTKFFKKGFPLPIVSIAKYRDLEERSGPIPTVNLQFIKIDDIDNRYPNKLLEYSLNILKNGVSKFKYITKPHNTELSGYKAAMTIFKFILYDQLGDSYTIKSEMWAIPRGEYAIYIAMSAPMSGPDASQEEFARILQSFKVSN